MSQPQQPGVVSTVGSSPLERRALSFAAVAVLVAAAVGAVIPGRPGRLLDGVAIAIVIAAPLLRVLGLIAGFVREKDWRFVAAAVALLAVVAAGALLA